jgi:hypothetical protein
MPAPWVALDLYDSLTQWPIDSPRNLLFSCGGHRPVHLLGLWAPPWGCAIGADRAQPHAGPRAAAVDRASGTRCWPLPPIVLVIWAVWVLPALRPRRSL